MSVDDTELQHIVQEYLRQDCDVSVFVAVVIFEYRLCFVNVLCYKISVFVEGSEIVLVVVVNESDSRGIFGRKASIFTVEQPFVYRIGESEIGTSTGHRC